MGYTTDFIGQIAVDPPLDAEEIAYLNKFSGTRRMNRTRGPYYCGTGDFGQDQEPDILDYNHPPEGQPGLWCQWIATEDGHFIEWDVGEKFYSSAEWMKYIIQHFIGPNPIAKAELPFLRGHTLNGEIEAEGEDSSDRWKLIVADNEVSVAEALPTSYAVPKRI
jgi:hypothetical protein